jgi:hypothetical protein
LKSRKSRWVLCCPWQHCHWKIFWTFIAFLMQFSQVRRRI